MNNLFADVPSQVREELVTVLVENAHVRVERIVSTGNSSPEDFWYDQDQHEWVVVLQGEAELQFEYGENILMKAGDHIMIPAHCKHRVNWTTRDAPTVWLAVFFGV